MSKKGIFRPKIMSSKSPIISDTNLLGVDLGGITERLCEVSML
jgi:hypothetical protein